MRRERVRAGARGEGGGEGARGEGSVADVRAGGAQKNMRGIRSCWISSGRQDTRYRSLQHGRRRRTSERIQSLGSEI